MEVEMSQLDSSEFQLVDLVKLNNVPEIINFISNNRGFLNVIIGNPFNKPILYIACHDFANMVNDDLINTLIKWGANPYQSSKLHGHKEAIHFAALGQNPAILEAIIDVVSCDVNKLNSTTFEGNTALNLLIKEGNADSEGFGKCVEVLVESGLDVNTPDTNNDSPIFWAAKKDYKEALNIILTKSKQKVVPNAFVSEYVESDDDLLYALFGCNKTNDEDSFLGCLGNFFDADDSESTFLQLATKWHLKKVVKALLNLRADPIISTIIDKSPVEIAVEQGFHQILAIFLQLETLPLPGSILILTFLHIDDEMVSPKIDHNKCYDLLINYKNLDLNAATENQTTALHFAASYGGPVKTLDLLRKGASLASKNISFRKIPVENMDANVLETHFNECIEFALPPPSHRVCNREYFLIATFNYNTLMPPPKYKNEDTKSDVETATALLPQNIKELDSELQVIYCISKLPKLRHLLKHPLISSFLFMKWHRIRLFYYCNLAICILFCLSLILHIFLASGKNGDEFQVIKFFLIISRVVLLGRETIPVSLCPKMYISDPVNYLKVFLLILTMTIVSPTLGLSDNVKRQCIAVAILLAAFELMVVIGEHPKMTTNILMLRTVSYSFFKFLAWYSILIIAFALSFYILFKKEESSSGKHLQQFFVHPVLSVFKTFVMLTGEFDTGNINFQTYPETSYFIFMLFVFMIAIVLFNLLNSLAISDTQNIISDAELFGHIARIEYIFNIEVIFLGLEYVLNKPFAKYAKSISGSLFDIFDVLIYGDRLFPFYLKDYKLTILLNQRSKVVAFEASDWDNFMNKNWKKSWIRSWISSWNTIYLDKQTARRTKELINVHKENQKSTLEQQSKVISDQKAILEEQSKVISEQKPMLEECRKVIRDLKSMLEEHKKAISDQMSMLEEHRKVINDQKSILDDQREARCDRKPTLEQHRKVMSDTCLHTNRKLLKVSSNTL